MRFSSFNTMLVFYKKCFTQILIFQYKGNFIFFPKQNCLR